MATLIGAAAGAAAAPATPESGAARLVLNYSSTNAETGSSARYGLLFPVGPPPLEAGSQSWTLLFDAELDVHASRRRVRFCYGNDRAGNVPRHSRCVEPIPAEINVSVGPGQDRITIVTQETIDSKRPHGVWVDLINPGQAGIFPIQLLRQPSLLRAETAQVLGVWSIRIEQRGFDSPGSDE